MRILGVDTGELGPIWSDKIERGLRGPGGGPRQLTGRNDLLKGVGLGDEVVVADPYCLGISPDDAAWFLAELSARGVSVMVSGDLYHVAPGEDASSLVAEVARRQNIAQVAAHRAAKGGASRKKRKSR